MVCRYGHISAWGGRHRGIIDNIVSDIFDGSVLYIIKTKGGVVVPVREDAITPIGVKNRFAFSHESADPGSWHQSAGRRVNFIHGILASLWPVGASHRYQEKGGMAEWSLQG